MLNCESGNRELKGASLDEHRLRRLLEGLRSGEVTTDEAVDRLRHLPYEEIGFARIDHHRELRDGLPEAIYGESKTAEQVATIAAKMLERSDRLIVTRASAEQFAAIREVAADAVYHAEARMILVDRRPLPARPGVVVLCAGTSDVSVAEEAALTSTIMGSPPERLFDVGVAGIHRLLDQVPVLRAARALVVVAGMEGALPSVVAGLTSAPVIAVPTSVGYGASFQGLAPLLAMLNACAPGVSVVNIDNGFGAGYLAATINRIAAPD